LITWIIGRVGLDFGVLDFGDIVSWFMYGLYHFSRDVAKNEDVGDAGAFEGFIREFDEVKFWDVFRRDFELRKTFLVGVSRGWSLNIFRGSFRIFNLEELFRPTLENIFRGKLSISELLTEVKFK
jgi:hypothetical protein